MNESLETLRPPPAPGPARARSPRLAWAITLAETALLAGAAIPLFKYWRMLPVPVRLGGATVLGAVALLILFRIVRFHLRWSRRRNNTRRTMTRPPEIEPEPAPVATGVNTGKAVPAELPCKNRLRNRAALMPSGSSTCP